MNTSKPIYSGPCTYERRPAIEITIGSLKLGGAHPVRLQSMANTDTNDTEGSVAQAERIIKAGADLLRYTTQGRREAANMANIAEGIHHLGYITPLVADVHFNPNAADEALEHIEKVRINPGNYVDTKSSTPREWTDELFEEMHNKVIERFGKFVLRAKELGRAIRIGVNHGSLSERMLTRYGDTPEGMIESCLEYLDVCRMHDFHDIVISMKSSNTLVMTAAVRLLSKTLSEEPEAEIPVAKTLVDYISSRQPLDVDTAILPDWNEYTNLSYNDRKNSIAIGKLAGGGNLPIVLSNATPSNSGDSTKADYYISDSGAITNAQGAIMKDFSYVELDCYSITEEALANIQETSLILLNAPGNNAIAEWRLGFTLLRRAGIKNSIILRRTYTTNDIELFRLQLAADAGTIIIDGWSNGLYISAPNLQEEDVIKTELGVLQATRLRMSKTEFISCPGCGRTLYSLTETIAKIKAATSHLKGLKIGVMGCIVNGPGEMADADYGYVGAAPGKIDLYKGQECIRRGIPQEEAVNQLIDLIKSEGDWREPTN